MVDFTKISRTQEDKKKGRAFALPSKVFMEHSGDRRCPTSTILEIESPRFRESFFRFDTFSFAPKLKLVLIDQSRQCEPLDLDFVSALVNHN